MPSPIPRTLKARETSSGSTLLGDNTNVATSKAGSVAHFEAETVVENLLREMEGKAAALDIRRPRQLLRRDRATTRRCCSTSTTTSSRSKAHPLSLCRPVLAARRESYMNHMGKLAFKWVYWNLLLPGHLPNVPLLARPHELPRQGSEHRAADPRRAGDAGAAT